MKTSISVVVAKVFVAVVLTFLLAASGRASDAFSKFEGQALGHIDRGEWQQALITLAEYEQQLLATYPPPSFEIDLFQDEASHLSFHSAFEGWKQVSPEELGMPPWLRAMGFHVLLCLKGRTEDDKLMVFTMNLRQLEQRIGTSDPTRTEFSDQEMQLFGSVMAGALGAVKRQEFRSIGDHRALTMEIGTPGFGPSIELVSLQESRQMYGFLLASSTGDWSQNEQRLVETVRTADFTYRLPDQAALASIRGRASQTGNPRVVLERVRQLAAIGAHGAAAEEVASLRSSLVQRLQPASMTGNVGRMSAYGVTLVNPDDRQWKLSVQNQGAMQMLLLEDKFSVKNEGMAIVCLNTAVVYGPEAVRALEGEEEQKQLLIGGGRGAALSIGTVIEREQFTTFKGAIAYEATVATNFPGVKGRLLFTVRPGHLLGVLMLVDAGSFKARVKQYQQILDAASLWVEGTR